MTLRIAIAGAAGRMGRALVRAAAEDARFQVGGGTVRAGSAAQGADLGALAGAPPLGVTATDDPRAAGAGADVWIDFTSPAATIAALSATPARAVIIGTTGFISDQERAIADAARRVPIVRSGNFSLGVHLLAALVRQAAAKLGPEWDIEILETHHRRKVDAPSGTALMLGEAAAQGRGAASLEPLRAPAYEGAPGPRIEGKIGFAVRRGGGIVGEHQVMFASEREVLTLSHQALDRAVFADGALAAALWVAGKPPGLYSLADVLGL